MPNTVMPQLRNYCFVKLDVAMAHILTDIRAGAHSFSGTHLNPHAHTTHTHTKHTLTQGHSCPHPTHTKHTNKVHTHTNTNTKHTKHTRTHAHTLRDIHAQVHVNKTQAHTRRKDN